MEISIANIVAIILVWAVFQSIFPILSLVKSVMTRDYYRGDWVGYFTIWTGAIVGSSAFTLLFGIDGIMGGVSYIIGLLCGVFTVWLASEILEML